ncbi:hypothetical protein ABFS82_06G082000 [Erythranthe guttata]|nr:PREDICTED: putative RING-H2 finger protein ATL71 [Erythranthe guttata]|eukprot:XP_012858092.1 PREDICTED: putative RING-H2 finger protein ATL71 [Erythranthe guttata]
MNSNWDSTAGSKTSSNREALVYDIGLTLTIFLMFAIVFYMYMRLMFRIAPVDPTNGPSGPDSVTVTVHQSNGLDGATSSSSSIVSSYPQFAYSEIGAHKNINESYVSACSICLADYEEADLIRLLPSCGHLFHLKCIDPWLIVHPTCPVCRSSPLPPSTPPLAPAT